jgi:RNA recognition motif. (a.k.a. RRM, RBD, or RNP domain)
MSLYFVTSIGDFVLDLNSCSIDLLEIHELFCSMQFKKLDRGLYATMEFSKKLDITGKINLVESKTAIEYLDVGIDSPSNSLFISLSQKPRNLTKLIIGRIAESIDGFLEKLNSLIADKNLNLLEKVSCISVHVIFDPRKSLDNQSLFCLTKQRSKRSQKFPAKIQGKDISSREVTLSLLGDIPVDAATGDLIKPRENVLFICKLNPITEETDLETIMSRFGEVKTLEIIKDKESGKKLGYAFVEFSDVAGCDRAVKGLQNSVIDDRKVVVDYSQSVAKEWGMVRKRQKI